LRSDGFTGRLKLVKNYFFFAGAFFVAGAALAAGLAAAAFFSVGFAAFTAICFHLSLWVDNLTSFPRYRFYRLGI
jgi:hypothetical protein